MKKAGTTKREQKIKEKTAKEKANLLKSFAEAKGIIKTACIAANVSRTTYYNYYNNDPEFRERADEIMEGQKDDVESLILKKMEEGDTTMIIFYAKTKMKDRGYTERREITGKDGEDLIRTKEIDLTKLSEEERKLLLRIGQDIINKKE